MTEEKYFSPVKQRGQETTKFGKIEQVHFSIQKHIFVTFGHQNLCNFVQIRFTLNMKRKIAYVQIMRLPTRRS